MTSGNNMRTKPPKEAKIYPRVCFRIDSALLADLNELKAASDLSYGQILSQALRRHMPEMKKYHAVK